MPHLRSWCFSVYGTGHQVNALGPEVWVGASDFNVWEFVLESALPLGSHHYVQDSFALWFAAVRFKPEPDGYFHFPLSSLFLVSLFFLRFSPVMLVAHQKRLSYLVFECNRVFCARIIVFAYYAEVNDFFHCSISTDCLTEVFVQNLSISNKADVSAVPPPFGISGSIALIAQGNGLATSYELYKISHISSTLSRVIFSHKWYSNVSTIHMQGGYLPNEKLDITSLW